MLIIIVLLLLCILIALPSGGAILGGFLFGAVVLPVYAASRPFVWAFRAWRTLVLFALGASAMVAMTYIREAETQHKPRIHVSQPIPNIAVYGTN